MCVVPQKKLASKVARNIQKGLCVTGVMLVLDVSQRYQFKCFGLTCLRQSVHVSKASITSTTSWTCSWQYRRQWRVTTTRRVTARDVSENKWCKVCSNSRRRRQPQRRQDTRGIDVPGVENAWSNVCNLRTTNIVCSTTRWLSLTGREGTACKLLSIMIANNGTKHYDCMYVGDEHSRGLRLLRKVSWNNASALIRRYGCTEIPFRTIRLVWFDYVHYYAFLRERGWMRSGRKYDTGGSRIAEGEFLKFASECINHMNDFETCEPMLECERQVMCTCV
jgi:hypothetical protein